MNAPAELYALALVALMDQQNVHHLVVDLDTLDPEKSRGLSLDVEIEGRTITVTTGRCDCPTCVAKAGSTQ